MKNATLRPTIQYAKIIVKLDISLMISTIILIKYLRLLKILKWDIPLNKSERIDITVIKEIKPP